jgi:hypothetical protein
VERVTRALREAIAKLASHDAPYMDAERDRV